MKNRSLYKLEFVKNSDNKCICVIRTDNNYGTQGYVYSDGRVDLRYTPYQIPQYIVNECMRMFNGD